jgi:hypothetical protein
VVLNFSSLLFEASCFLSNCLVMALNLGKPKEVSRCLAPVNPNVATQIVSKQQREKLSKVIRHWGEIVDFR